ncbi:hypothetical protein ERO13_A13G000601v2 [Gossypium hirsutum]|nr:hypothetical protein ERO13_A13G000601v2 [Gossypium hirsutum]
MAKLLIFNPIRDLMRFNTMKIGWQQHGNGTVFPLTLRRGDFGRTQLDMQGCRQWVKSRMEDRGAKPCEFSLTAPPHKPSNSVSNAWFSP